MNDFQHIPVLLSEAIDYLKIKPDGIYVDCTLGGAGHAQVILSKLVSGRLIAFDQDEYAIKRSQELLTTISNRFVLVHDNFVNLKTRLLELGITKVDGILYDLGVSSFQFDIPERGFSYHNNFPLDMRMNQNQDLNAEFIVNNYSEQELKRILFKYGEEKFAPLIARKIVQERSKCPIKTTFDLVEVVKKALPAKVLRLSQHPARLTFQALRIEVNQELSVLKASLNDALDLLNLGGRIVVITFHSLEDRLCKQLFKEKTTLLIPKGLPYLPDYYRLSYQLVNKKAIIPSNEELNQNRRSHSAKLRAIERISI